MSNQVVGRTTPYEIDGESGSVEGGKVTSTLSYHVSTLEEAKSYGPLFWDNVPLQRRSWKWSGADEGYDLTLTYFGPEEGEGNDGLMEVELDAAFSEKPIDAHPNIEKIRKIYNGHVDPETKKTVFSPYLSGGDETGLATDKKRIKNPMFGLESYLSLSAIIRYTKIESSPPDISLIGTILEKAPAGFATPRKKNWMIMPMRSRRLASGDYQTTYELMLSERGGWPRHVYGFLIDR